MQTRIIPLQASAFRNKRSYNKEKNNIHGTCIMLPGQTFDYIIPILSFIVCHY